MLTHSQNLAKLALLFVFFSVVGLSSERVSADDQPSRPNIIYILADDLGYGDLSCYGQTKFKTPNIDRLASQGMRFTQHYAGCTVCAPSRSCIFTGLHTGHTPIRGNTEVWPEGQASLPNSLTTLPKWLQSHNYATGLVGKWGLGAPETDGEPLRHGFSRFYGYNCQRQAHHYYPYFLWSDDRREILWDNFGLERGAYAPDLIQEQALHFIDSNHEQPFFLCYAHVVPHAEMFGGEKYMDRFRGKFGEEKPFQGVDGGPMFRRASYGSQPEPRAAFAAMVTILDDHVGQVVAKVNELGIADKTLIIFSSDNGPHQEGGHDPDYFQSSGGLRGYKRDLYEGGIRVPMIANWKSVIRPGSESDHLSAQWDLFPTLADAAGAPVTEALDGLSFLSTLTGEGKQPQHDLLYWEFHERKGRQAVRQGKWKAVRYEVSQQPDSTPELYDLSVDPRESNNLASSEPEVVAKMKELLSTSRSVSDHPGFNFPRTDVHRKRRK